MRLWSKPFEEVLLVDKEQTLKLTVINTSFALLLSPSRAHTPTTISSTYVAMSLPNRLLTKLPIPLPPSYGSFMFTSAFALLALTSFKKLRISPTGVIGAFVCTTIVWKNWGSLKLEHLNAVLDERMEARGACRECRVEAYRAGPVEGYGQLLDDLENQREWGRQERAEAELAAAEELVDGDL